MRDNDDDVSGDGSGDASLADGLGEIIGSDGQSSAGDPFGDDGTFGDGEQAEVDVEIDVDDTGQVDEVDPGALDDVDATTVGTDGGGLLAESASPLEGVGYILDELRDALLGDDADAAADDAVGEALSEDPVDLATDTDLDLTGDGVVDGADLAEAESPFDFGVDAPGG